MVNADGEKQLRHLYFGRSADCSSAISGIFGLTVIPTVSIAAGSFLVGSGNPAASEIRDRMELTIEVSTEHASFFTQILIAVRGEKRLALVCETSRQLCQRNIHECLAGSPLSCNTLNRNRCPQC